MPPKFRISIGNGIYINITSHYGNLAVHVRKKNSFSPNERASFNHESWLKFIHLLPEMTNAIYWNQENKKTSTAGSDDDTTSGLILYELDRQRSVSVLNCGTPQVQAVLRKGSSSIALTWIDWMNFCAKREAIISSVKGVLEGLLDHHREDDKRRKPSSDPSLVQGKKRRIGESETKLKDDAGPPSTSSRTDSHAVDHTSSHTVTKTCLTYDTGETLTLYSSGAKGTASQESLLNLMSVVDTSPITSGSLSKVVQGCTYANKMLKTEPNVKNEFKYDYNTSAVESKQLAKPVSCVVPPEIKQPNVKIVKDEYDVTGEQDFWDTDVAKYNLLMDTVCPVPPPFTGKTPTDAHASNTVFSGQSEILSFVCASEVDGKTAQRDRMFKKPCKYGFLEAYAGGESTFGETTGSLFSLI